jgi:lysine-N-methylase
VTRSETLAFRYMSRFQCIGSSCEDDCCTGWQVAVDQQHAEKLRARMSGAEEAAELVIKLRQVELPDGRKTRLMLLDENRACTMLGPDKLCTIQSRYGEEYIPNTCAVYPRWTGSVGRRVELSGKLSCPEVARLALFGREAMTLEPVGEQMIARGLVLDDAGSFERTTVFEPVRAAVMALLEVRGVPLASRLLFIGFFAERLRGWLTLDAACDRARLRQEIEVLRQQGALGQLHGQFQADEGNPAFALQTVIDALTRLMETASPRFHALVQKVRESYAEHASDGGAIWEEHHRRDQALPPVARDLLEQALERVLVNQTFQAWFTHAPSLFDHVAGLALRYAVLRYLLVTLLPRLGGPEDWERSIVEAVYSFTRTADHAEGEGRALASIPVATLDELVSLAKV